MKVPDWCFEGPAQLSCFVLVWFVLVLFCFVYFLWFGLVRLSYGNNSNNSNEEKRDGERKLQLSCSSKHQLGAAPNGAFYYSVAGSPLPLNIVLNINATMTHGVHECW